MQLQSFTGYSAKQYHRLFDGATCHILIGSGPKPKPKYDKDKQRYVNDEITSFEIETYFEGLGSQDVKFPKTFKLSKEIKDLTAIELVDAEACVIDREVYVRAKGIRKVD